jgi:ubiquinone/menaquinone biosynthesis C-methylase UbiE
MRDLQDKRQYLEAHKLEARIRLHSKYGAQSEFARLTRSLALPRKGRILEIGCGTGEFWREVSTISDDLDIILTDLSRAMVHLALERARSRLRTVRGLAADACALPFSDGMFETVVARHVLFHVEDIEQSITEIWFS